MLRLDEEHPSGLVRDYVGVEATDEFQARVMAINFKYVQDPGEWHITKIEEYK
jgi:hypothetical protein